MVKLELLALSPLVSLPPYILHDLNLALLSIHQSEITLLITEVSYLTNFSASDPPASFIFSQGHFPL